MVENEKETNKHKKEVLGRTNNVPPFHCNLSYLIQVERKL
jgi:hypothetical protein